VVSGVRKASCCQNSTECAAAKSGPMGCGNPSSPEEILQGFQQEIPSQEWVHMHGRPGFECHPGDGCWPQEATLQKLLAGGAETPVFWGPFHTKSHLFSQDRLGTDTRKTLQKQALLYRRCAHRQSDPRPHHGDRGLP